MDVCDPGPTGDRCEDNDCENEKSKDAQNPTELPHGALNVTPPWQIEK